MSEIQTVYILLSVIVLLFFLTTLSVVCSIVFEYRDIADYKFSPPSSNKILSFDTEDDISLTDLIETSENITGDY